MVISAKRLLDTAVARWGHTGKVDRDDGTRPRLNRASAKRTIRGIKKRIRRYVASVLKDDE